MEATLLVITRQCTERESPPDDLTLAGRARLGKGFEIRSQILIEAGIPTPVEQLLRKSLRLRQP